MSTDEKTKQCGNCYHYMPWMGRAGGRCTVPLPWWIEDAESKTIYPEQKIACMCECFHPRP